MISFFPKKKMRHILSHWGFINAHNLPYNKDGVFKPVAITDRVIDVRPTHNCCSTHSLFPLCCLDENGLWQILCITLSSIANIYISRLWTQYPTCLLQMWTSGSNHGSCSFVACNSSAPSPSFHFWIAWLDWSNVVRVSSVTYGLLQGPVLQMPSYCCKG